MPKLKGAPLSKRQRSPRLRTKPRKLETRVSRMLFKPYPPRKGAWLRAIKPGSTYDGMVFQWNPRDHNVFLAAEIRRATKAEIAAAREKEIPPTAVALHSAVEARSALQLIWGRHKIARSYMRRNGERLKFYCTKGETRVTTLARLAGVNVSDLEFAVSARRVLFSRCRAAEAKENRPVNPLDNVSDAVAKPDPVDMSQAAGVVDLHVPPIHVRVIQHPSDFEGGSDGGSYGHVLVRAHVHSKFQRDVRYETAERLRALADFIAGTVGDPIETANITVLMGRLK